MRKRRGNPAVGAIVNIVVLVVGGAGLMFLALRLGIVPPSVLGSAPAQTAVSLASTAAPAIVPSAVAVARAPESSATAVPTATGALPAQASQTPVPTLVTPSASAARPSALEAARKYLAAWEQQRYPEMYKMLSSQARATIAEDRFLGRYQAIMVGATVTGLKASPITASEPGPSATKVEVPIKVTFQAARLGEFAEENRLPLVFEENAWRVDWTPGLIFRDLTPDRSVRFVADEPVRGAILDRNGQPLAAQGKIVTLGAVPGRIKDLNLAVNELSKFLGVPADRIRQRFSGAKPDWWVPFKDFPLERRDELAKRFAAVDGVLAEEKDGRIYPNGTIAAHVIGFVSPVNPEDLKALGAKGYDEGDMVGRAGVERSAEETLAGVRGGKLTIVDQTGETIRSIAERPARNGGTVHLTVDIGIQKQAEAVIGERVGSLVMIDPRDNSIVALVSRPSYDPNGFIIGFSDEEWKKLSDDPQRPFQPRATMSTYPTGSVFKTVTMAAGLERGGFQANTGFTCNGVWGVKELGLKKPMGDWLPQGHGRLDLAEGLVESCDIVFYELGHKLNQIDPEILSGYAHQFGFGEPTGVQGIQEATGIVASPDWKKKELRQEWFPGDAVNLAIGQGYLDATPLQVANSYAVLANGGVLRTPLLIKKIVPAAGGGAPREFQAQERSRVSVSGQNLAIIRDALKRVASAPKGTANYALKGYKIPVAAKTGSAENQNPDAHAWFAGFGPADDPRIVVTVMIEGGKQGGTVAAPLGRQAFEIVLGK